MMPMMMRKVKTTKATIPRSQLSPFQVRGFLGAGAAAGAAGAAAGAAAASAFEAPSAAEAETAGLMDEHAW